MTFYLPLSGFQRYLLFPQRPNRDVPDATSLASVAVAHALLHHTSFQPQGLHFPLLTQRWFRLLASQGL
jgi:hypothetical protein